MIRKIKNKYEEEELIFQSATVMESGEHNRGLIQTLNQLNRKNAEIVQDNYQLNANIGILTTIIMCENFFIILLITAWILGLI